MPEKAPPIILVPTASPEAVRRLFPLLAPIAEAWTARVVLLHVHLSRYEPGYLEPEEPDWLDEIVAEARGEGMEVEAMQRAGHNTAGVIREAVAELSPRLLVLHWLRRESPDESEEGSTLRTLLLEVPCNVIVWRGGEDVPLPRRILIASAGGPNAALAMQLARFLSRAYEGEQVVLSVVAANADESTFSSQHEVVRKSLAEYIPAEEVADIRVQVVRDRSASAGILNSARPEDYDLVMIGASREGVLHRLAFGVVPETVAAQADIPVLVIKRPLSRSMTLARRAWEAIAARTPTLAEGDKIDAYRNIRRSARPGVDFYTMMGLSAAIAALGLLLDSAAVVIGAMLVAPLMAAIVAMGLGVVQGDARLLRMGFGTALRGSLLAVGISLLVGLLFPGAAPTGEMEARSAPQLFDLAVAVASGAAGAYALCRKDVSSSLPGVAIAVALVPPLSTVGLMLSMGAFSTAGRASLLFVTNLVGIATTGGLVFLLLGFRPEPSRPDRIKLFSQGWRGLLVLLVLIALPLTWLTQQSLAQAALRAQTEDVIADFAKGYSYLDVQDLEVSRSGGQLILSVKIELSGDLTPEGAQELEARLEEHLGEPIDLNLRVVPTLWLDSRTPQPPAVTPTPG